METLSIAIDGPAGAGKSTVAKKVAILENFLYIDTGAMYRALTWKAIDENVDLSNGKELKKCLEQMELQLVEKNDQLQVLVDGKDVSELIRSQNVTDHVSEVSAHKEVREPMVEKQRELAEGNHAVLDGRDIGSYVLPNASVKIFLTASVNERANRRHVENTELGSPSDLEEIKASIRKRDEMDATRELAPLIKAEDAIEIDTTNFTSDEVVEQVRSLIRKRVIDS
ncbi:(d)CMP kinase [Salsuginibacillus kocurii]|uniref:(d)CMP kinase n=1 Tax=Salsuginibacillus kocurii TaxID=427078 RepID=UPI00036AD399|nr:(d)CMP kinase [Salsuginibacillus kocurii]